MEPRMEPTRSPSPALRTIYRALYERYRALSERVIFDHVFRFLSLFSVPPAARPRARSPGPPHGGRGYHREEESNQECIAYAEPTRNAS